MSDTDSRSPLARRSFLSRLGAGAAAFGAAVGGVSWHARRRQPSRPGRGNRLGHAEDDWLEEAGKAKHRFFLDTNSVTWLGHATFWANNYCTASRGAAYGLTDADSSVVICVRHESTPFAFTDAMWAKYGEALAEHAVLHRPEDEAGTDRECVPGDPGTTLLTNQRHARSTPSIGHGVGFAVCSLATRGIAAARRGRAARRSMSLERS